MAKNEAAKDFINSISKVFIYKVIVYMLMTMITVLSARNLTTSEFGHTGIINGIAYLLFVPMLFGVQSAMYKFLPESDEKERNELILISLVGSFITIAGFSIIYLSIYNILIKSLNIPVYEWQLAVILTVLVSLSTISESYLRGQKKFDAICKFKLVSSLVNLGLILLCFFILNIRSLEAYFYSLMLSQIIFSVLAMARTGVNNRCKIKWQRVKEVYFYSGSNILSMFISGIIFSSDLFFVNYFCSSETVGVYNAYQGFVKNIFSILFYEIFLVVFLPFIAKANHHAIKKRIRRYTFFIFTAVLLGSGFLTSFFVLLFGKNYPLNFIYIMLSSLGIALYTIYQLNVSIYNMEGSKSAMSTGIAVILVLPVSFLMQYFLTRQLSVTGALISVIFTNVLLNISLKVTFSVIRFVKRTSAVLQN